MVGSTAGARRVGRVYRQDWAARPTMYRQRMVVVGTSMSMRTLVGVVWRQLGCSPPSCRSGQVCAARMLSFDALLAIGSTVHGAARIHRSNGRSLTQVVGWHASFWQTLRQFPAQPPVWLRHWQGLDMTTSVTAGSKQFA